MNKRQREIMQHQLDEEKKVLDELEKQYKKALRDIELKIRILESDELTQSRIYRLEYQKALKQQVEAILERLHADEYTTIQQFLSGSYTDGFLGTVYDMHGQGVPLIFPIDPKEAVAAVMTESKLSVPLYEALGVDTKKLSKTISSEISRGIASSMAYTDIARNIANASKAPLSRAKTIVQTESHRIQEKAALDAQYKAKSRGADVVKQWNSTLDGDTRPMHRKLDGQIQEVDKPFMMHGRRAMYPGAFGRPEEDCNCRCRSLTRARWALDEDELQTLKERAEFFGLNKQRNFKAFKDKYLSATQTGGKDYAAWNERRTKKATGAYSRIRNADDIAAVAKASGMTEQEITTIKKHVFFDSHILYTGEGRFAPDYDMAVAWDRLVEGKPEERDILLLKHELLENQVEKEYNITASEAHEIASEKYDWESALFALFGEEGEPDGLL